jgi:hypothetical protein
VAAHQKGATRLKAALVFLDESGFLMAPLLRRSWAPRGATPILLQRGRSHEKVSAIATLVVPPERDRVACYFRLHPDANITAPLVLSFLRQLARQLAGTPFIIIWDRLQAHRAANVQSFLRAHAAGNAFLPAYAPELNPVEYIWNYLKTNPLANLALIDLTDLTSTTHRHARCLQRTPGLLRSFIHHSPLSLSLK